MVKQRLMLWIQSIAGGLAGALGLLTVVWPRPKFRWSSVLIRANT